MKNLLVFFLKKLFNSSTAYGNIFRNHIKHSMSFETRNPSSNKNFLLGFSVCSLQSSERLFLSLSGGDSTRSVGGGRGLVSPSSTSSHHVTDNVNGQREDNRVVLL